MMRRLYRKRGQSTLEYVIIWTAIVAAILVATNSYLRPAIDGPDGAIARGSDKMLEEVGDLVTGIGESGNE